jgi:predicted metal-dependent peptidase
MWCVWHAPPAWFDFMSESDAQKLKRYVRLSNEHAIELHIPFRDFKQVMPQLRSAIVGLRQLYQSGLRFHIVGRRLTRMKPNQCYGFQYMGSRYDFTTRLLFAVDVSGSMSGQDLALGFSVINRFFTYGVEAIEVIQFDTEIKGDPVSLKRGRGGASCAPVMRFLDEHRDYDGAIIFTDGYAPVPPRPKNRRTRVLWLFKSEESYRRQHEALRAIGRAAFLKEAQA